MRQTTRIPFTRKTTRLLYCTSDNQAFTNEQSAYNHAILLPDESVIAMTETEYRALKTRQATNKAKCLKLPTSNKKTAA